jgi:predicted  nucleic acid-binding Zn-ribbon protein
MSTEDKISRLLSELEEARKWPARFRETMDGAPDVTPQIQEADRKIESLEKRAKEAMKSLRCVNPKTKSLHRAMADMLINWQTFKDDLK